MAFSEPRPVETLAQDNKRIKEGHELPFIPRSRGAETMKHKENICPICKKPVIYPDTINLCGGTEAHKQCISKLRIGKFRKAHNQSKQKL